MTFPKTFLATLTLGLMVQVAILIVPGGVPALRADAYDKTCLQQCNVKHRNLRSSFRQSKSKCKATNQSGVFMQLKDGTIYRDTCKYYDMKIEQNKVNWHACTDTCQYK